MKLCKQNGVDCAFLNLGFVSTEAEFLCTSSYGFVLCFSEFLSVTYEQMVIGEDGFDMCHCPNYCFA